MSAHVWASREVASESAYKEGLAEGRKAGRVIADRYKDLDPEKDETSEILEAEMDDASDLAEEYANGLDSVQDFFASATKLGFINRKTKNDSEYVSVTANTYAKSWDRYLDDLELFLSDHKFKLEEHFRQAGYAQGLYEVLYDHYHSIY